MSFLRKILLFLNMVAAIALIAGGLSIYVNPNNFWVLSFFGLLYLPLLVLNLFFFFFWVVVRFKYLLISIVAIGLTLPVLKSYFAFHWSSPPESPGSTVKVMSYNVRNFDLYNWQKGEQTLEKIMVLIKEEQPDIVCLQEFFNADSGKFQTIRQLMDNGGFRFYRFEKTVARERYGAWGVATFSRYPIVGYGGIRFPNSKFNSSLYTDIKIDSFTLRVFNAHLQSVYLSAGDYEYIEHVAEDQEVQVKPTRQILSKLKHAFQGRALQSVQVNKATAESPFPVLLCGDFNDTPASFCYHTLSSSLNDAFLCRSRGIGPTYSGFFFPFRIDYILTDKKLQVLEYKTIRENYSDHYPIVCLTSIK